MENSSDEEKRGTVGLQHIEERFLSHRGRLMRSIMGRGGMAGKIQNEQPVYALCNTGEKGYQEAYSTEIPPGA